MFQIYSRKGNCKWPGKKVKRFEDMVDEEKKRVGSIERWPGEGLGD